MRRSETEYIEYLENGNDSYAHFLRPRRFGKTLFTSTLQYYYDISEKDNFERLFKDTYIGEHPTKEHNSYYVLRFDFSAMNTEKLDTLINVFHNIVYNTCIDFIDYYNIPHQLEQGYDMTDTISNFLVR